MAMRARDHFFFWVVVSAAFFGFVFLFKSVLLPFVLGMAVAYLLNPLVNRLGGLGLARGPAALLILFVFVVAVSVFFAALIPVLYKELSALASEFPDYIEKAAVLLDPVTRHFQSLIGHENGLDLKVLITQHGATGLNFANAVLLRLAAGGQAVFELLSVVVFTPIVAYFMMKEWTHILAWGEGLMPRDHKKTIKKLLVQIDQKLSGFVRGQIGVVVLLGVVYAVALSLAGLQYGFLIGIISGLLSIIPMVGSTVGLITGVAVAWFQSGDLMFVAMIGGIFIVGQLFEGNIITPKLVGDSVGLHPLWVFFALLAGSSLFGIVGMLLAVPVAAVAGVLIGFALERYKTSQYFRGSHGKQKTSKKKKALKGKGAHAK